MRANFDEIKTKIKSIDGGTTPGSSSNINYTPRSAKSPRSPSKLGYFSESNRFSNNSLESELKPAKWNKLRETERENKIDKRLDQINNLGGKLYDKLIEKVSIVLYFLCNIFYV